VRSTSLILVVISSAQGPLSLASNHRHARLLALIDHVNHSAHSEVLFNLSLWRGGFIFPPSFHPVGIKVAANGFGVYAYGNEVSGLTYSYVQHSADDSALSYHVLARP